jgi:hypothetical protein
VSDSANVYSHIVGNGSSSSTSGRSNAHTLDWEGNAWYSGDVYVGSTSGKNKDEGSEKLVTESYVNNQIVEVNNQINNQIAETESYIEDKITEIESYVKDQITTALSSLAKVEEVAW